MTESSTPKPKQAPKGSRYCRHGHLKDLARSDGRLRCRICKRDAGRRRTEAVRQARLAARRETISRRTRPPLADCAWAAGLFEGEGTISLSRSRGTSPTRAKVSVGSTDRSIVDFFAVRWPGYVTSHIPDGERGRCRRAYIWSITSFDAIEGFLLDMRPHFRTRRVRAKMRLMLKDVRARAELRRGDAPRRAAIERMERMQVLNKRGVDVDEADTSTDPRA